MAIVVETHVPHASREQADALDATIEAAMMERDGPPPGLMVHFQCPDGDGFRICNVWRSEAEMNAFYSDVLRPKLAEADLAAGESQVAPVWGFARP